MNPRSIARDVRSLGPTAPLRAAYEASKRFGGHRVVFGTLARRPTPPTRFSSALRLPANVPEAAMDRAVKAADQIAAGTLTLFSEPHALGAPPNSQATIDGPGHWPQAPWWTIDIRSNARLADVKWAWELGRTRHLAVLARAGSSGNDRYRRLANDHVLAWATQNPPEVGIHWYSNLEIALRAIVLTEVGGRIGDQLSPRTQQLSTEQLWHSGRHLVADLPYTISTMRNNHLMGDSLGLQVIGRDFPGRAVAKRWALIGERLFDQQAARHFRRDGSMVEDSLSYHRFVLEMLATHALIEPRIEAHPALVASAQMLARLGALDGLVPQYGDWDEGRVLISTQTPSDVAGSVRAALSIAGNGASTGWREAHDECAWYAEEGEPVAPEPAERDGHDVGGGIARAVRGSFTVWLKAGSGPSHGHADLCSTPMLVDGDWVIGDPGTGTYNGPLEQRDYFRSSIAHNVLRLGGHDQLEPQRAFRWAHTATGMIGPPVRVGGVVVMWGAHDAYRRLTPSRRIVRTVIVAPESVSVADWVEGPRGQSYALSIPLGPEAAWEASQQAIMLPSGKRLHLHLGTDASSVSGQTKPFDGWWSHTYGQMQPSVRLEVRGHVEGPVFWSVAADQRHKPVRAEDDELIVGDLSVSVDWSGRSLWLSVNPSHGSSSQALLRWPV